MSFLQYNSLLVHYLRTHGKVGCSDCVLFYAFCFVLILSIDHHKAILCDFCSIVVGGDSQSRFYYLNNCCAQVSYNDAAFGSYTSCSARDPFEEENSECKGQNIDPHEAILAHFDMSHM